MDDWVIEASKLNVDWNHKIGSGAFADVFSGCYRRKSTMGSPQGAGCAVAVKALRKIEEDSQ